MIEIGIFSFWNENDKETDVLEIFNNKINICSAKTSLFRYISFYGKPL